jgi:hypothetical protein
VGVLYLAYRDDDENDKLPHRYTSHSGLTIRYPDKWTVREAGLDTHLANRAEVLDARTPTQSRDVIIRITPPLPVRIYYRSNAPITDVLNQLGRSMSESGSRNFGNAESIKIGDRAAARAALLDPALEGFVLLIRVSDEQMVLVYATGITGSLSSFESTALDIARSIRYSPPQPTPTP